MEFVYTPGAVPRGLGPKRRSCHTLTAHPKLPIGAKVNVDRILIDRRRAVLDEGEAVLRVAAHQPLDEVLDRLAVLGIRPGSVTRSSERVAGSMVVSLSWLRVHFAEALEAATSTFLPLNSVASSSARWASSRA